MNDLKKTIFIGVAGSIAAYKACDIIREFVKRQMDVHVVMTPDSHNFITETTLAALSRNPVATDLFSSQPYGPIPHCEIAQKMDVLLVAPATANTIAKFAHGFADEILSAIFLATSSPVLIAPAMNPNMYSHPMVQENINKLEKAGVIFINPIQAEVACGQKGPGHLAPVDRICDRVEDILHSKKSFKGRSFIITAGPTREFIDPVRFISNRSSGKMGYALARAAQRRGAKVTLISGPVAIAPPDGVDFLPVNSAEEMLAEVKRAFSVADVVIMAAAVADFRPIAMRNTKIKKEEGIPEIRLESTTDILTDLGRVKGKGKILIGFAAEDRDLIENAQRKLNLKCLDFIVANDISVQGTGFDSEANQVTIIHNSGEKISLPREDKLLIAEKILDELECILH
ncbi:bifunctional phosphopantothenoylcysteine decarboxylase/phosphopantothenate--cysteine ligase CoaBC [bacterium]|nr:bifunctional phosphopantothenoylcysteine decarboxylase/phosphopantothenate--cysteine ligase CoaBC [bacterium]